MLLSKLQEFSKYTLDAVVPGGLGLAQTEKQKKMCHKNPRRKTIHGRGGPASGTAVGLAGSPFSVTSASSSPGSLPSL